MENESGMVSDRPWGWRERLSAALYPRKHCPLPDAPATFEGVLVSEVHIELGGVDWLRVLASGRLRVETRIVTEFKSGRTVTAGVVYPVWRFDA